MAMKNKERLRVIGKLIGIYREELRENSQNEYTLGKFCEGICSVNTLKNIEMGKTSRSEDVYVELLRKFDLEFYNVPAVDDALINLMPALYNSIEYFDNDAIDEITKKALRVLDKVKNVVFYSEIHNIITDIRNYYLNLEIINDNKFKIYTSIYSVIDSTFSNALILLIFSKLQKIHMNDSAVYHDFIKNFDIANNKMCAIKMMMAYYYALSTQYIPMKALIEELEIELMSKKNYARLIGAYSYAVVLFSYIDPVQTREYINKAIPLASEKNIPMYKLHEIYSFIGNALHHLKEYEEALKYYEKALKYFDHYHVTDLIFMADCQNRLRLDIVIPVLSGSELAQHPKEIQLMYNYFAYYDMPQFTKENIIIKDIAPSLKNDDFIDVFQFELEKLIEESGHYKAIYNFNQIVRENGAI